MANLKSPSATGERIASECRRLVRDYERRFGVIPAWVEDELCIADKVRLLGLAVEVRTPLPEKSDGALMESYR